MGQLSDAQLLDAVIIDSMSLLRRSIHNPDIPMLITTVET